MTKTKITENTHSFYVVIRFLKLIPSVNFDLVTYSYLHHETILPIQNTCWNEICATATVYCHGNKHL
jgi:hypothetical protein